MDLSSRINRCWMLVSALLVGVAHAAPSTARNSKRPPVRSPRFVSTQAPGSSRDTLRLGCPMMLDPSKLSRALSQQPKVSDAHRLKESLERKKLWPVTDQNPIDLSTALKPAEFLELYIEGQLDEKNRKKKSPENTPSSNTCPPPSIAPIWSPLDQPSFVSGIQRLALEQFVETVASRLSKIATPTQLKLEIEKELRLLALKNGKRVRYNRDYSNLFDPLVDGKLQCVSASVLYSFVEKRIGPSRIQLPGAPVFIFSEGHVRTGYATANGFESDEPEFHIMEQTATDGKLLRPVSYSGSRAPIQVISRDLYFAFEAVRPFVRDVSQLRDCLLQESSDSLRLSPEDQAVQAKLSMSDGFGFGQSRTEAGDLARGLTSEQDVSSDVAKTRTDPGTWDLESKEQNRVESGSRESDPHEIAQNELPNSARNIRRRALQRSDETPEKRLETIRKALDRANQVLKDSAARGGNAYEAFYGWREELRQLGIDIGVVGMGVEFGIRFRLLGKHRDEGLKRLKQVNQECVSRLMAELYAHPELIDRLAGHTLHLDGSGGPGSVAITATNQCKSDDPGVKCDQLENAISVPMESLTELFRVGEWQQRPRDIPDLYTSTTKPRELLKELAQFPLTSTFEHAEDSLLDLDLIFSEEKDLGHQREALKSFLSDYQIDASKLDDPKSFAVIRDSLKDLLEIPVSRDRLQRLLAARLEIGSTKSEMAWSFQEALDGLPEGGRSDRDRAFMRGRVLEVFQGSPLPAIVEQRFDQIVALKNEKDFDRKILVEFGAKSKKPMSSEVSPEEVETERAVRVLLTQPEFSEKVKKLISSNSQIGSSAIRLRTTSDPAIRSIGFDPKHPDILWLPSTGDLAKDFATWQGRVVPAPEASATPSAK